MKSYETYVVVKATLTKEQIDDRIAKVKEQLTSLGGEIILFEDYGVNNLAYEIDKNKRGYIFVIYHKSEPEAIKEIERVYRITEDILRYLTIKYEGKKELKALDDIINKKLVNDFVAYKHKERPFNREDGENGNREYHKREYNRDKTGSNTRETSSYSPKEKNEVTES